MKNTNLESTNPSLELDKYTPPEWSSLPLHKFTILSIKHGSVIDKKDISEKEYYILGKSEKDADIVLQHPTCSRIHCVIQHLPAGYCCLFDLGSSNKTFLNKRPLRPFEYVKLRVGDFFQVADSSRHFQLEGPSEILPPETDETLDYESEKQKNASLTLEEAKEIQNKQEQIADKNKNLKEYEMLLPINKKLKTDNKEDFCSWGQENIIENTGLIDRNLCKTKSLRKKYDELMETVNDKNNHDTEYIQKLREELEDEIYNSKLVAQERRKQIKSYIDDDNDEYYDRTIKKSEMTVKSELPNDVRLTDAKMETKILMTNLSIKINRLEREKTIKEKEIEKDSLDSFMAGIEVEKLKRKIKKYVTIFEEKRNLMEKFRD